MNSRIEEATASLFDAGPPRGWSPAAGEDVYVCWGASPAGLHITAERVVSTFVKGHYSGQSWLVAVLACGACCGRNSMRPCRGD